MSLRGDRGVNGVSLGSAQHPTAVSPATFALFGISAVVLGGIGSARLWEAHIGGPPMPLERMLPLVLVAELLAYFAIMLARSYNPIGAAQVASGVLVALAVRGGQAALAALVAAPAEAERFLAALGHYHAQYFPGALLQIGVACLFLWLVKGAFEARPAVLAPATGGSEPPPEPEAQEAVQETAQEAPADNGPQRRRELIEQLMRREEDVDEAEAEPEPEPIPEAPAAEPERPAAPAPEAAAPADEHEPEPSEAAPVGPDAEEAPPQAPAEEPPAEEPAPPAAEEPRRREARPSMPPSLSARESVIQALREDDEDEEPELLLRLPLESLPGPAAAPEAEEPAAQEEMAERAAAEAGPAPEEGEEQPSVSEEGEEQAPLPSSSARDAISAVTEAAGAGAALTERSAAGRLLIIAAPEASDAGAVAAPCEAYLAAAACLCEECGLGDLRRTYLRPAGGYVAATAVMAGGGGAWATLAFPPAANLGSADDALRRVEEAAGALELPGWSPPASPELMPAYPDPDLETRIGPLFEWVPQAAGLTLTVGCAGGQQVAMLTGGAAAAVTTAAAVARAHTDAERLCAACGLPDCGMALVAGGEGAAAWASADVAGQRLLVCLVRPGGGGPGPVSIQLRQIISGLGEVAGAGAERAE